MTKRRVTAVVVLVLAAIIYTGVHYARYKDCTYSVSFFDWPGRCYHGPGKIVWQS